MDSFILNYTLSPENINKHANKFIVIYAIMCPENNTILVGSSTRIKDRPNQHRNNLRKQQHPNKRLQYIYNKYKSLEVIILEFLTEKVTGEDIKDKETTWIQKYKQKDSGFTCINSAPPVNTWDSLEWTEEQKAEYRQKRLSVDYSVYRTKEHREKISKIVKGKKRTQLTKDRIGKAMRERAFQMEMIYTVQTQEGNTLTITGWYPLKAYFKEYNKQLHYHKRIHVAELVKYKAWNGVKILRMVKHIFGGKEEKHIIKYQDPAYSAVALPVNLL